MQTYYRCILSFPWGRYCEVRQQFQLVSEQETLLLDWALGVWPGEWQQRWRQPRRWWGGGGGGRWFCASNRRLKRLNISRVSYLEVVKAWLSSFEMLEYYPSLLCNQMMISTCNMWKLQCRYWIRIEWVWDHIIMKNSERKEMNVLIDIVYIRSMSKVTMISLWNY